MTEWDQIGGLFRRHDARYTRYGDDISLTSCARSNGLEGFRLHSNNAASTGHALSDWLT